MIVADLPALEAPKTREMAAFLGSLELKGKTLVLTNGRNQNAYLSARNLGDVEVMPFGSESVYDVLWASTVVIEKGALEGAEDEPKKKAAKKPAAKKKAAAKKPAAKKAAAKKPAAKKAAAKKADTADEDTEEKTDA